MHIKKLEICGFKSFVDRTVIQFDHDVIGVVGPNGCGKSNIVDAIRWCMGEQSARQLRGKSMDDVIFAGSERRKPHGFAEVTLTFTNDGDDAASLPLEYRDYPEIAVTRRLYRDGTSEYLINKTPVRLKDITDLFLGTGVGTRAYSIVEQGKIGLIVSAKPEDRRLLIEEAAGITKYKHRKKQAEKKIELTRQNLLRVGDIVAEIERNLASLKRQAAKAERYLAYKREHDDLVLHEASHRLLEITARDKYECEALQAVRETVTRLRTELASREARLEAARAQALHLEQQADQAQNDAFRADNDVRSCEAEMDRARDKLQTLGERLRTGSDELAKLSRETEHLTAERATLRESLESLENHEREGEERLRLEESRLHELERQMRECEARAGDLRKRAAASAAAKAAAQERLAGFDRRTEELRLRREKLAIDAERFREDRAEAEEKRAQLVETCQQLHEDAAESARRLSELDQTMKGLRQAIVESERELERAKNDLSQQRGRLRGLEEVHARLEGVGRGTRALIDTHDPCIVGLVADILEADEHVTQAFAALVGEQLQAVVVRDVDRAAGLLASLAGRKQGRATVVPMSPPFVAGQTSACPREPGVIGPMVAFLRHGPEYESLARAIAGDAIVVQEPQVAWRLRSEGVRATIVTLDGTVFHPNGRISGGTGDAVAAGLLQQKRQLRELRESVAASESQVEKLLARHTELRTSMNDTSSALDRARAWEREVQLEKVTADGNLRRVEDTLATVSARVAEISREADELDGRLEEASLERDEVERKLHRAETEAQQSQAELAELEAQIRQWSERVSEQAAVCTERKVMFARVREQAASGRTTVDRLTRSIDELELRIARLDHDTTDAAKQQGQVAALLYVLRERIGELVEAAKLAHEQFDKQKLALEEARAELGAHEAYIKTLRTELQSATETEQRHDMAAQKLAIERDHLLAGVAERFRGLHLPRVVGDYHLRPAPDETHRARIQELATLIDRMGPVNLDAMAEYDKAAERFEFYTTQKTDLEKAIADLEHAIQQMNRESRRLFRETFDSVNERFQTIFPKMFRGGRATLTLTNPDDLLETGVDIQAQPPGKKIGSIELLSGGEKALTAVSLIFAIFQHKPSPFCVLDEVDAPLDEANVARFNDMVRQMTDRSQFIMITHIKRTMQSVDVLYGVTMQEAGVSRVVSVKVNQNAPPRWTQPTTGEAVA